MSDTDEPIEDSAAEGADAGAAPSGQVVQVEEPQAEVEPATEAAVQPRESQLRHDIRERLVVPLLLPIAVVAVVIVLAVNFSRIFLSSSHNVAVIVATILTIAVLVGAAITSTARGMRAETLTIVLASVVVLVIAAGLVTIGTADETEGGATGYVEPTGNPVGTVTVDALPTLKFQADEFNAKVGVNKLEYIGKGGTHTLVFSDPKFAGFELEVNGAETDSGKVDLTAGTFEIYCSIPGHKAAGMDGNIIVK